MTSLQCNGNFHTDNAIQYEAQLYHILSWIELQKTKKIGSFLGFRQTAMTGIECRCTAVNISCRRSFSSGKKPKFKVNASISQSVGFEPTLPEGNWFLVSRLNHSATAADEVTPSNSLSFSSRCSTQKDGKNRIILRAGFEPASYG